VYLPRFPFLFAVSLSLLKQLAKGYVLRRQGHSAAARLAYHWQNGTNHKGPLQVFVEQGTIHEGDIVECFLRDGLSTPIPVPKDLAASQAADLFAWERSWYNNTSIRRPSMEYLKAKMPDGIRGLMESGKREVWIKRCES
jgi:hypothetical protein